MGLTHCPLCVGLAVVAALRFCAHGWLLVASGLLEAPPLPPRRHPVLWVRMADRGWGQMFCSRLALLGLTLSRPSA